MIDLHTHTTASDGSFTPDELIAHAKEIGLSAVAITDHDSVDGLSIYDNEIEIVPGIELSCDYKTELHIVGLFIDKNNKKLNEKIQELVLLRNLRNQKTLKALHDLGMDVTEEEIKKLATGKIWGRAHFARLLYEKGYVESTKDAFRKYLGHNRPCYIQEDRMKPQECLSLIRDAGGIPILAHVHYLHLEEDGLILLLKQFIDAGLMGMETIYTEYNTKQEKLYTKIAENLNLLKSGGSDFHGFMKPNIQLGTGFGNLNVPDEFLDSMKRRKALLKSN